MRPPPFTFTSPEFRQAYDRIQAKMGACGCGYRGVRMLKPEEHRVFGPVFHAVCPACGRIDSYAVDVVLGGDASAT